MRLHISEAARRAIVEHGEGGYPNEVCGLLLGSERDAGRIIEATVPVENSFEAGEQFHRFLITPNDMFRAERAARSRELDVLGVYHSHPNAEACPSEYDRDHAAWTAWTYVIVSVREGRAVDLRVWRLREDRSAFDEEPAVHHS